MIVFNSVSCSNFEFSYLKAFQIWCELHSNIGWIKHHRLNKLEYLFPNRFSIHLSDNRTIVISVPRKWFEWCRWYKRYHQKIKRPCVDISCLKVLDSESSYIFRMSILWQSGNHYKDCIFQRSQQTPSF